MALSESEILRMIAREEATTERQRMIVQVQRKRQSRARTLGIRNARFAKYSIQGRPVES